MRSRAHLGIYLVLAVGLIGSIACATSSRCSSSVVQYLYPDKNNPVAEPEIPNLSLPVKVGIAFVPDSNCQNNGSSMSYFSFDTLSGRYSLTEKDKMTLMEQISDHFKKYDFVGSIEIIPSAYLRPAGSFANLDQIRTMYGVDVIALISYDQTQFTDEGVASITYWTLVGAYVIPGEKNDTHTMVDAAVYDIPSRKMLFRAPGISHIKNKSTPVNLTEQLRKDSLEGFDLASEDLVVNLDEQLEQFRAKVKERPEEYQVSSKPGYKGAGAVDVCLLVLALGMAGIELWRSKN